MHTPKKYQGIVVPLVTPLTARYALDETAVEKIFEHIDGCLPFVLGTTGEAASIPADIKNDYVRKAASLKKNNLLYAGIGSNVLQDSIDMANRFFDAGTDVVVATLPSYYQLTENQVLKYFEKLANGVKGPLMIYNIPATTHMSIPLQIIDELSHHENIVGLKDSERNEERLQEALALWSKRADFSYFLGWAAKSAVALLNGADGIVPSTANFEPSVYRELWSAAKKGDAATAHRLQEKSDELGNLYQPGKTLGESLAALKALMKQAGLCETYMMPPL